VLLEAEIERLIDAAADNPEIARHLLGFRFYLSDLVERAAESWWSRLYGMTYYADLLQKIGEWRADQDEQVVLATFNYDTLLDRTASDQVGDWSISSFSSYVERSDWRLYKLHGSTNWSRAIDAPIASGLQNEQSVAEETIRHAPELDISGFGWADASWRSVVASRGANQTIAVPAIAVPTAGKYAFECPPAHVDRFVGEVTAIDRLLVIGWRATEPHALALLAQLRPGYRLGIVDPEAEAVVDNLGPGITGKAATKSTWEALEPLVEHDDVDQWLRLPIPVPTELHDHKPRPFQSSPERVQR